MEKAWCLATLLEAMTQAGLGLAASKRSPKSCFFGKSSMFSMQRYGQIAFFLCECYVFFVNVSQNDEKVYSQYMLRSAPWAKLNFS